MCSVTSPPRRLVCSMGPIPMAGVSRRCGVSATMKRSRRRTSDSASAWPVAMGAGPIRSAPVSGSIRHSVSSCTTARPSTGSSSTMAWTGCAGTACSSDSRRDEATRMAPTADVTMRWLRELQFEGNGTGRPPILVDGNSKAATSPVELLLVAAATCTASDVVIMLQKQRVKLEGLDITVRGTRRETEPRRYPAIAFRFVVRGEGADDVKVRRAIDLSLEKYCSVVPSLAPDISISYDVAHS